MKKLSGNFLSKNAHLYSSFQTGHPLSLLISNYLSLHFAGESLIKRSAHLCWPLVFTIVFNLPKKRRIKTVFSKKLWKKSTKCLLFEVFVQIITRGNHNSNLTKYNYFTFFPFLYPPSDAFSFRFFLWYFNFYRTPFSQTTDKFCKHKFLPIFSFVNSSGAGLTWLFLIVWQFSIFHRSHLCFYQLEEIVLKLNNQYSSGFFPDETELLFFKQISTCHKSSADGLKSPGQQERKWLLIKTDF